MGKEMMDIEEEVGVQVTLGKSLEIISNNNTSRIVRDLPLLSLNHFSYVCKSVRKSVEFYERVLGFVLVQRPSSFDFEGAWLFNHGIGIHLLQQVDNKRFGNEGKSKINPKDNHISFQCTDMDLLVRQLEEMGVEYVKAVVREGGVTVDQIFFHDPDAHMIEICNCHNLPVLPLSHPNNPNVDLHPSTGKNQRSGEVEALMMENLAMDMVNFSI